MKDPINSSSDMMQTFMRSAQRKTDVIEAARTLDRRWVEGSIDYHDLQQLHHALERLDEGS